MEKTVVTILATNYSGSHYLSLLLGSNSRALHIGEVKGLRKTKRRTPRSFCSACGSEKACTVLRGVTPDTIADVYPVIFSNVSPDISTLIDTSKKTFWAELFLNDDRYAKRYIHLLRDPRALIRRWMTGTPRSTVRLRIRLARAFPLKAPHILFGGPCSAYLYKWLYQNKQITDFLSGSRLDYRIVTYRDLALDTSAAVRSLTEWIGLSYEPGQLSYWNFTHHGTQKETYEWIKEQKRLYFDTRWKAFLPARVQHSIVHNNAIQLYLDSLGITPTDDGLNMSQYTTG